MANVGEILGRFERVHSNYILLVQKIFHLLVFSKDYAQADNLTLPYTTSMYSIYFKGSGLFVGIFWFCSVWVFWEGVNMFQNSKSYIRDFLSCSDSNHSIVKVITEFLFELQFCSFPSKKP